MDPFKLGCANVTAVEVPGEDSDFGDPKRRRKSALVAGLYHDEPVWDDGRSKPLPVSLLEGQVAHRHDNAIAHLMPPRGEPTFVLLRLFAVHLRARFAPVPPADGAGVRHLITQCLKGKRKRWIMYYF